MPRHGCGNAGESDHQQHGPDDLEYLAADDELATLLKRQAFRTNRT
jgi:hypothetical protein